MESKSFIYWLQGFFELAETDTLDKKQVETIKNHLKLVFLYDIDPSYSDDATVQAIFQNIHDGKKPLDGINVKQQSTRPMRTPGTQVKC